MTSVVQYIFMVEFGKSGESKHIETENPFAESHSTLAPPLFSLLHRVRTPNQLVTRGNIRNHAI